MKRKIRFSQMQLSTDREVLFALDSEGQIWYTHFPYAETAMGWIKVLPPEVELSLLPNPTPTPHSTATQKDPYFVGDQTL